MDLEAYVQLEDLDKIAKQNRIEVPRLRGYRLTKDTELITQGEINDMIKDAEIEAGVYYFSKKSNWLENYYLVSSKVDGCRKFVGIRWDKIHGRKRKELKFAIKQKKKAVFAQWNMWNKYAGKENVLYIHARIGGTNWNYFNGEELRKQTWFLDKVDDSFDSTYCDIYARIEV